MPSRRSRRQAREIQTEPVLVVIQILFSQWGKDSRGGSAAGVRNAVPEAYALPPVSPSLLPKAYLIDGHRHLFGDIVIPTRGPDGIPRIQPLIEPYWCDNLRITLHDDGVHVDFIWQSTGMPKRSPHHDVLLLQPNQWGRVQYNARYSTGYIPNTWDMAAWWYEKWVVNIGLLADYTPNHFLTTKPVTVFSQMADLW